MTETTKPNGRFKSREAPKFVIRYDGQDLIDALNDAIANSHRSLNSEILHRLRRSFPQLVGSAQASSAPTPVSAPLVKDMLVRVDFETSSHVGTIGDFAFFNGEVCIKFWSLIENDWWPVLVPISKVTPVLGGQ